MRLVNTKGLQLEEFSDETQVRYGILSHRWDKEEVLYSHITTQDGRARMRTMKGFRKIEQACRLAAADGLTYVWIDTCCIDKSSSAELQEAINSMYRWYATAKVCYAHLSDVYGTAIDDAFVHSQWFRRGWTLQELIAPPKVEFFNSTWDKLGSRADIPEAVNRACRVPVHILTRGVNHWAKPYVSEIMSWAAGRRTTRIEDRAYSLLGLFDVHMPMLYGEGNKAFRRLQEEILKQSEDQSIFAWEGVQEQQPGLLAHSPDQFAQFPAITGPPPSQSSSDLERRKPHAVTNEGISVEVELTPVKPRVFIAKLNLEPYAGQTAPGTVSRRHYWLAIFVKQLDIEGRYARIPGKFVRWDTDVVHLAEKDYDVVSFRRQQITVVRRMGYHELTHCYWIEEEARFILLPADEDEEEIDLRDRVAKLSFSNAPAKEDVTERQSIQDHGLWKLLSKSSTSKQISKVGASGYCVFEPGINAMLDKLTIILAFDQYFEPLCVFAFNVEDCEEKNLEEVMYRQHGWKSGDGTILPPASTDRPDSKVQFSTGDISNLSFSGGNGQWQVFQSGALAIRCTPQSAITGQGLRAELQIVDRGPTIRLHLSRVEIGDPWYVNILLDARGEDPKEDRKEDQKRKSRYHEWLSPTRTSSLKSLES